MTETTGEIKPTPRPFEENAYKYADEQAELYRGLKEPSGGYALIVDAYIAGAKRETTDLEAQIEKMKCCENCENGELSAHEEPCLHCQRCFASTDVTDQENVKDNWEAIKEIKEK